MLVPLAVGGLLLAGYAAHASRPGVTPVLDPRLFARRPFASAAALGFLSRMSIFGAMLLMPLYLQQVRGQDALAAGLLLAPQSAGLLLGLLVVGRLTDRLPARPIVLAGLAIAVAGTAAYTRVGPDTSLALLAGSLLVWGAGLAAVTVPVLAAAYHGLPPGLIPRATSALTTVQTVGASFGAAVLLVILQARIAGRSGPVALAAAYGDTFWWALAFTGLAFVPALLLPSRSR